MGKKKLDRDPMFEEKGCTKTRQRSEIENVLPHSRLRVDELHLGHWVIAFL
jgi:hypothetical protein